MHGIPDWHSSPFRPGVKADASQPWHKLGDFDARLGDIKTIWEASRFEWLIPMAQRVALGDAAELIRLNGWLANWSRLNPPYLGVNWKCGQEASIRVLHLAAAALILDQADQPLDSLRDLLRAHLRRIAPTMAYAIGQQNNHGTTEAAALFVGGSWLAAQGEKEAIKWERIGRHRLAERAETLIEPDGTFSQYSVVYHRVMLDCYAFAESWRRRRGLTAFAPIVSERLKAAVAWLFHLVDPVSGDAPNLGANDGARLFPFSDTEFRDFRPSLQWAAALFCDRTVYPLQTDNSAALCWLGLTIPPNITSEKGPSLFDDGGFAILRNEAAMAVLRYPRFRFRPSQCDVLHLDFWVDGKAVLRDAGSYSYASTPEDYCFFSGVQSHNTISFDDNEQMSRLSRFLFGDWPIIRGYPELLLKDGSQSINVEYRGRNQTMHRRHVRLTSKTLLVTDEIGSFSKKAILRWRLPNGNWTVNRHRISNGSISVTVDGTMPLRRFEIVESFKSLFYLKKEPCLVLEAEMWMAGTIKTRLEW